MKQSLAVLVLILTAGSAEAWCRASDTVERQFDTGPLGSLAVIARAGELRLEAHDSATVSLNATLCARNEESLAQMSVADRRDGDRLTLEAVIPHDAQGFNADNAYIDLVIKLPASLLVEVQDSSGDIEARGVSIRSLQDSSGRIRIIEGRSGLTLEDSSGDVDIAGLAGDLEVTDSSGDLRLRQIQGAVRVLADSSGDIVMRDIERSVRIDRDSSGDIRVEAVRGEVRIDRDSSGSIRVSEVGQGVYIGSDSTGEIEVADVGGDFEVAGKGRGRIRSERVQGEIRLPER